MSFTSLDAPVQIERRDGFWFARLNRPDKRNALSEPTPRVARATCAAKSRPTRRHAPWCFGALAGISVPAVTSAASSS